MEVSKIMKGIDRVDCKNLFPTSEVDQTRGHRFRVKGKRCRGDPRGTLFTQTVLST